jgi:hypothetical protein
LSPIIKTYYQNSDTKFSFSIYHMKPDGRPKTTR